MTGDRANDALFVAVLIALGLGCAAGLYFAIAQIPLHVLLDPNEGWNAYHAQAAITGAPLYPGPNSLMINNYPPLSFYIVGMVGTAVGDTIVGGRLVSLLALLNIAIWMILVARMMGAGFREAAFAVLLFAATLLLGSDYVGINDPQLFGESTALIGVVLLLKEPRGLFAIANAAIAFVIAGFIKHNLVVMPLAMAIWLFVHDRRAALQFVGTGIVLTVAGLFAFRSFYGVDLLTELNSPRSWSAALLVQNLASWLSLGALPIAGLVLLFALDGWNKWVQLVTLIAGIGIAVGIAFLGGVGVDMNAMFDADIGLALASALLLTRLPRLGYRLEGLAAVALAAPFAVVLAFAATPDWLTGDFWLRPGADDAEIAGKNIAFLRAHPGPALCESLSLCYWADKKAEVDVFNLGEAYKTGARSDDALVRLLEDKAYAVVQFETPKAFPLTARVRGAVLANYRIDHIDDNGIFLVRK
jgi:hypothetical protein